MSKDIIKVETPTGEITLSPQIVRSYLVSGDGRPTDQEIMMFLALCKHQRLNPFLREAYLIKYGSDQPATIVVGKEAYLKRASAIPDCRGYAAGVVCQCQETGELIRTKGLCPPGCTLVGGWARVKVAGWDEPLEVEVSLHEYVARRRDGQVTGMWRSKPATMIRKVALVQALREAFPTELGGMYSEDEMPVENLPRTPVEVRDAASADEAAGDSRDEDVVDADMGGAQPDSGGDEEAASRARMEEKERTKPKTEAHKSQNSMPGRRSRRKRYNVDPNEWDGLTVLSTCGITPDQIMTIRKMTRANPGLRKMVQAALAETGYTQLSYLREDEAAGLIERLMKEEAKDAADPAPTGEMVECPVAGQVDRAQCETCETRRKYGYCPVVDDLGDEEDLA